MSLNAHPPKVVTTGAQWLAEQQKVVIAAEKGARCLTEFRLKVDSVFTSLKSNEVGFEEDKGRTFIKQLKDRLSEASELVDKIEKIATSLPHQSYTSPYTANLLQASQLFPDYSFDRVLTTYGWFERINEVSSYGFNFVRGLTTKAGQSTKLNKKISFNQLHVSQLVNWKEKEAIEAIELQRKWYEAVTGQSQNQGIPPLKLNVTSNGQNVHVIDGFVDSILQFVIVCKGLYIEWINIKSANETFTDHNGKKDLRTLSKYDLFRKMTQYYRFNVIQNFHNNVNMVNVNGFKHVLNILKENRKLYCERCQSCKKILKDFLPPYCRETFSQAVYHESCHHG